MNKPKKEKPELPHEVWPQPKKELEPYLGAFVIEFERVMVVLRATITMILSKNGLKTDTYSEILMYDSTAKSLSDYYCAFIARFIKGYENDLPYMKEFISIVYDKLNEAYTLRNLLLHSSWNVIHFESKELIFFPERYGVNKAGLKFKYPKVPDERSFAKVNNHLKILANRLNDVCFRIEENKDIMVASFEGNEFVTKKEFEILKALHFSFE